ncbi:MAG: hypothetical protein ACLQVD_21890 [Capsulimonadaceae bacterium]
MKQPSMIVAPAQAEALYDAELENCDSDYCLAALNAEWDDQGAVDEYDAVPSIARSIPAFSGRALLQPVS